MRAKPKQARVARAQNCWDKKNCGDMVMFDVHIVGAGPAGSFCAVAALKRGKSVLVSEEHARIGEPVHCSGLVSQSGLEEMREVVDYRRIALNRIESATIFCGSEHVRLKPKKAKAILIDRGEFDRMAAQRAQSAGAKFELGKKISRLEQLQSECIVGADGPASEIARLFHFPKIKRAVSAYQADYECGIQEVHDAKLYISPSHFPGFFGWMIPIDEGHAKIGFAVKPGASPKKAFGEILHGIGAKKPANEFGALIPIEVRKKTAGEFGKRRVFLAGDAAGQVKATTGGGIYFGASCGKLAGELCPNAHAYEREWRREYGKDLQMHALLRKVMDIPDERIVDALLFAFKGGMLDRFISEHAQMDRWGDLAGLDALGAYLKMLAGGKN
ncbi:Digeranylgeranylglycerophospholipid reductase [Candidatus Anstonella stagnisolia]|nr:Digeranylgeranylglycerophospholipid reductase [Candidatus Anstonella stagnisolia]